MGELCCYNQGPVTREMAWNCLYLILCGLGEQQHHSEPLFTMERTQTSFSSCRHKKRGWQCSHRSVQCLAGLEAASFPRRLAMETSRAAVASAVPWVLPGALAVILSILTTTPCGLHFSPTLRRPREVTWLRKFKTDQPAGLSSSHGLWAFEQIFGCNRGWES